MFNTMIKTLTSVGNSKAVIIPKRLINKYKLTSVIIREAENGILILPAEEHPSFQDKLEDFRKHKKELYARIKEQASDPETIRYYDQESLSEVDVDIIEE